MKKVLVGVAFATAAVALVQGCMPETLEVGRSPVETGGAAGEGDSGGSTGGSVAANGGESGVGSGSGSGGGSAGRAGVGGKGGMGAGRGGSSRGGGAGGGAGVSGAGTSGEGGDPPYTFDPACDCGAYIDDNFAEFICFLSPALFAEHFSPPENCDLDQNYARKQACGDGMTRYKWQVGGENDYEMVFDGDTLVYGEARGYELERACNFTFTDPSLEGSFGNLQAGSEPEVECTDECAICETGERNVPWCYCQPPAGESVPVVPLDVYCETQPCPGTVAEAREGFESNCPNGGSYFVETGCGLVTVSADWGLGSSYYYYDSTTQELVGLDVTGDTPWGECNTIHYRAGEVPPEPCEEATTCGLCGTAGVETCPP